MNLSDMFLFYKFNNPFNMHSLFTFVRIWKIYYIPKNVSVLRPAQTDIFILIYLVYRPEYNSI